MIRVAPESSQVLSAFEHPNASSITDHHELTPKSREEDQTLVEARRVALAAHDELLREEAEEAAEALALAEAAELSEILPRQGRRRANTTFAPQFSAVDADGSAKTALMAHLLYCFPLF